MSRRPFITAVMLVSAGAAHAQIPGEKTAIQFMTALGSQVQALPDERDRPFAERQQQFAQLVESTFDMPRIASFTLGRYWRAMRADERRALVDTLHAYIAHVYWQNFTAYDNDGEVRFVISGQRDEGNGLVLVSSRRMLSDGRPSLEADWLLARQADGFKVEDVSLQGISQLLSYRDWFSMLIEKNNGQVAALIDDLRQQING